MTSFDEERRRLREKIWSFVDVERGKRILDIGVGRDAHSLKKLIELGFLVTSIDVDLVALRKHSTPDASFVQCNAAQLPLRNRIFGMSIANFTFHEIDPILHQKVFVELCRVSDKIMIIEPAHGADPLYQRYHQLWTESMHSIGQFEDYQTIEYWTGLLKKCGADIVVSRQLVSTVRLIGQEAKKYLAMVIEDMREEGVPEKYVSKMLTLGRDVESKGMLFSDINVIVARVRHSNEFSQHQLHPVKKETHMKWQKTPQELVTFLEKRLKNVKCQYRKMFGCPAYFINHNMFIGAFRKDIFIRLPPGDVQEILKKYPEMKPFTPRAGVTMKEYVAVPETLYTKKKFFSELLKKSIKYVRSLPPKMTRKKH